MRMALFACDIIHVLQAYSPPKRISLAKQMGLIMTSIAASGSPATVPRLAEA